MFSGRLFGFFSTLFVKPITAIFSTVSSAIGWTASEPQGENEGLTKPAEESRNESETSLARLALDYLHRYGELIDEGAPNIYKLSGWKRVRTESRIRRFELGQPTANDERTILIVGDPEDTGEWIDGLINHVLDVEWADRFRFQLIDPNRPRSSFTLHRAHGMRIDYTLTLVKSDISSFAKTLQALDQVHLVCFLTSPSSDPNLVQELKYLLSSFDHSVSSSIKWIVTSRYACSDLSDDLPLEIYKFHNRVIYEDNTVVTDEDRWMNIEYDQRLFNWREQSKLFDHFLSNARNADAKCLQGCHRILESKKALRDNMAAIDRQVELCKMKKAYLIKLDNKMAHIRAEVEAGPACYMKRVIEARVVKQKLPHGSFTYYCNDCAVSCELFDREGRAKIESQKNPLFWRSCNSKTCTCPGNRHWFRTVYLRRVSVTNPELMQDKQLKQEYEEKCRRLEALGQLSDTIRDELSSTETSLLELIQEAVNHIETIRTCSFYIPAVEAAKSVFDILDEAFDRCETPQPSPFFQTTNLEFNHETYRDELIYRLKEWTLMSHAIVNL